MAEYTHKIRAIIDNMANPEAGPYHSSKKAKEIVAYLRLSDPSLLEGWLQEQAPHLVREMINARDRSRRAYLRATDYQRASVFAKAVQQYEQGDAGALNRWSDTVYVISDGNRKRLAEMTAEELQYVSSSYESREKSNRMMKAFLRAVAGQIGDGRVEDYLNEEQLRAMWASIAGKES